MNITILDAKAAPEITLALWNDPAIQHVNDQDALIAYVKTGDATALTMPDTPTLVTIRALSAKARKAAARKAGRKPHLGLILGQEKEKLEEDKDEKALAAWHDNLLEDEVVSLDKFEDWLQGLQEAICAAGVVKVVQGDHVWDSLEDFLDVLIDINLISRIRDEVARKIRAYSGLDTRPKGLLPSQFGLGKPVELAGNIGSAAPAPLNSDELGETVEASSPESRV